MSPDADQPVVLGKVSGLYGVSGWVRIHSYTDPRDALLGYAGLQLGQHGEWLPVQVAEGRPHGKSLVGRFEGIDDRDAAAPLVGAEIAVRRSSLPPAGKNEFYWADLEGLTVRTEQGKLLGTVAYLLETGANDVLVVRDGAQEVLIPFLPGTVVRNVDLENGRITVDWEWE